MRPDFQDFVDRVKLRIIEEFNKSGECHPTWYLQKGDISITEVVTKVENALDKEITDACMRIAIKSEKVQRYAFAMEAWYVPSKTREHGGLPPSQRSDRKEGILFMAQDIHGDKVSGVAEIHRSGWQAMINDIDTNDDSLASYTGRFANMFDERKDWRTG